MCCSQAQVFDGTGAKMVAIGVPKRPFSIILVYSSSYRASHSPFQLTFSTWSVFFLVVFTRPRYCSSARERWKSAL